MSGSEDSSGYRRRARGAALACVALACGAVTAWGRSASEAVELRRQLAVHGFSALQAQTALATLERAAQRGLPAVALEHRLREGLARHAEPAAIQRVLERRLGELTAADELARRGSRQGIATRDRQGSLSRVADSLALGVASEDVARLLPAAASARRDFDSVSRAAEVMGRAARRGSPAAVTRDVLGAALGAGWTRDRMDGLGDVFASARRLGLAREQVRQALVDGIRHGEGLDRLGARLEAEAKAAVARSGRVGSSTAASPRSGESRTRPPKAGKGGSTHGARPPARGVAPRAPVQRPHAPRPVRVLRH